MESDKDDILFLLDEPDITLHPQWQKKYIHQLIYTFKNIGKKIHFIVTSHSPFILSDLPKENVIFLKDGKQVDVDINTFGANIHTLLSHGFFIQDGLMGEFAKEKINDVIKLLKSKRKLSKKNQELCKNIISKIGEPILKSTLKKMLDEKLNSNESELERLKREQKEIQDKIDKLKANNEAD
jgi:predicted ATP-binding protein involved in virulence